MSTSSRDSLFWLVGAHIEVAGQRAVGHQIAQRQRALAAMARDEVARIGVQIDGDYPIAAHGGKVDPRGPVTTVFLTPPFTPMTAMGKVVRTRRCTRSCNDNS